MREGRFRFPSLVVENFYGQCNFIVQAFIVVDIFFIVL